MMTKEKQSYKPVMFSNRLAAHMPWHKREHFLPFLCQNRISPEVFLSARDLSDLTPAILQDFKMLLLQNGLSCSVHAPFEDMDTGSADSRVITAAKSSVVRTLRLSEQLKPDLIVCHSGYNGRLYGPEQELWIDRSINFWKELLPDIIRYDACLALENVFEPEPSVLRRVIEGVRSTRVRHCFDVGHFNVVGTVPLERWFSELGRYCVECHLHDNMGNHDEHLAIGKGNIDFKALFNLLGRYSPDSLLTLEAHSMDDMKCTFSNIRKWVQIK